MLLQRELRNTGNIALALLPLFAMLSGYASPPPAQQDPQAVILDKQSTQGMSAIDHLLVAIRTGKVDLKTYTTRCYEPSDDSTKDTPKQSLQKRVDKRYSEITDNIGEIRADLEQEGFALEKLTLVSSRLASRDRSRYHFKPFSMEKLTGPLKRAVRIRVSSAARAPRKLVYHLTDYLLLLEITDGTKVATIAWLVRRTPLGPGFPGEHHSGPNHRIAGFSFVGPIKETVCACTDLFTSFSGSVDQQFRSAQWIVDRRLPIEAVQMIHQPLGLDARRRTITPSLELDFSDKDNGILRVTIDDSSPEKATIVKGKPNTYEYTRDMLGIPIIHRITVLTPMKDREGIVPAGLTVAFSQAVTEDIRKKFGLPTKEESEAHPSFPEWFSRMHKGSAVYRRPNRTTVHSRDPGEKPQVVIHFVDGRVDYVTVAQRRFDEHTSTSTKIANGNEQKGSNSDAKTDE
jgi:hypothetical protein